MNQQRFGRTWSVMVGGMDAVTGLVLVFYPLLILKILNLPVPEESGLVLLSWVGVFVASVGFSYGFALQGARELLVVWKITALVRLLVASFLIWKVSAGDLVAGWLLVAVSDASVAVVQLVAIRFGCGKEVQE